MNHTPQKNALNILYELTIFMHTTGEFRNFDEQQSVSASCQSEIDFKQNAKEKINFI